ncbi:MAG: hypothetical protein AAF531_21755 [Actinomycetota bacterium]
MNAGLTRRKVAEAAVRTGFRNLTLTAVAQDLGVTHVALYRHVRDRADLGHAAAELVAQHLPWPSTNDDWETHLRAVCHLIRNTFQQHPGLYDEVVRLGSVPSFERNIVATAMHLIDQGFTPNEARLSVEMLFHLVLDSVRAAEANPVVTEPDIPEPMRSTTVTFEAKVDVLMNGIRASIGTEDGR